MDLDQAHADSVSGDIGGLKGALIKALRGAAEFVAPPADGPGAAAVAGVRSLLPGRGSFQQEFDRYNRAAAPSPLFSHESKFGSVVREPGSIAPSQGSMERDKAMALQTAMIAALKQGAWGDKELGAMQKADRSARKRLPVEVRVEAPEPGMAHGVHRFQAYSKGEPVGMADIERIAYPPEWQKVPRSTYTDVDPYAQRQGVASQIYDKAEEVFGEPMRPSRNLTGEGKAFWAGREIEKYGLEHQRKVAELIESPPAAANLPSPEAAAAKVLREPVAVTAPPLPPKSETLGGVVFSYHNDARKAITAALNKMGVKQKNYQSKASMRGFDARDKDPTPRFQLDLTKEQWKQLNEILKDSHGVEIYND